MKTVGLEDKSKKQKVLDALEEARFSGEVTVAGQRTVKARHGWVASSVIGARQLGGTSGLRRLRELRSEGHGIEKRSRNGRYEYRLKQ